MTDHFKQASGDKQIHTIERSHIERFEKHHAQERVCTGTGDCEGALQFCNLGSRFQKFNLFGACVARELAVSAAFHVEDRSDSCNATTHALRSAHQEAINH